MFHGVLENTMREFYPDVYYFITIPTINRMPYFNSDIKKDALLESILIAKEKFNLKELDYCILENHHHFMAWFENNKIIPQVVKQISGRSGKLLNKHEDIKSRKVWDDYYIHFVDHDDVYYRVRGYIIGNAYKHGEVNSLGDLVSYKYSTFKYVADKLGQREAEAMVLSSIAMNDEDWAKELGGLNRGHRPHRIYFNYFPATFRRVDK